MNELETPSTHEILRDLEANTFTFVKSKEIEVYFQLSNLYRLLTAESYQSFSKNKEYLDKLSLKDKKKELKEMSKKAKPFCKKADAKFKG